MPRGRRRDGRRHASAPPLGLHGTPLPRAQYRLRELQLEKPGSERGGGGRRKEEGAALTLRQRIQDGMEASRPEKSVGSAPARSICGGGNISSILSPLPLRTVRAPFLQAAECLAPSSLCSKMPPLITQKSGLGLGVGVPGCVPSSQWSDRQTLTTNPVREEDLTLGNTREKSWLCWNLLYRRFAKCIKQRINRCTEIHRCTPRRTRATRSLLTLVRIVPE